MRFEPVLNRPKKILARIKSYLPAPFTRFVVRTTPYIAVIMIALFSLFADYAKASEAVLIYQPSEEMMDMAPADVADIVSTVSSYTQIDEDPVTVALAVEDSDFLGKPIITDTNVTKEPQVAAKRTKTITYTVDPGDTLSSIGWKYGLKLATIKTANGLKSDLVKPGQQLQLPPQDLDPQSLQKLQTKRVAGASSAKIPFSGHFGRPTRGWSMSQTFGRTSFERYHTGIDLDSRSGTAILASASGQVVSTSRGWGGGYGNHIVISHGGGFTTLYGHLSAFMVSAGQWVNAGQQIGIMGSTGWSTGTHLHFEIRAGGSPQNPLKYL